MGNDGGRRFQSVNRSTTIGAHPDCDLDLNDAAASRFHAQIEIDQTGHRLRDLGSKNGTFVNGMRVLDVYLTPNCQLKIGHSVFEYRLADTSVDVELSRSSMFGNMIGASNSMREIFALLNKISPTEITLLVEGESGTGKELVAEAVHMHSSRANGPFIVFDCSAVSPTVIESELFGHRKGAFTGAINNRTGAFKQADGGTLFLDEFGELPIDLQPKLLRALEQRVIRPVGSDQSVSFDARIIAATNRNLKGLVEEGTFRADLYYRLAVMKVRLPSLRDRIEDLPLLVAHFLSQIENEHGLEVQVGYETIKKLQKHSWPGNIRELKNFVDRAAILAQGNRLETKYLVERQEMTPVESPKDSALSEAQKAINTQLPYKDAKSRLVEEFERAYWEALIKIHGGNISAAARQAGVHRKSAEYLIRKLDISTSI